MLILVCVIRLMVKIRIEWCIRVVLITCVEINYNSTGSVIDDEKSSREINMKQSTGP